MTDVEKRAKRIVYDVARAVERWRERNGGKDPIIVMTAALIGDIMIGAPTLVNLEDGRCTLLGCRVEVVQGLGNSLLLYLAEEVTICV